MNVLVTGGLGVNGSWVTRKLLEDGHKPVVYENRLDTTLIADIASEVPIVNGDIMDLATAVRTARTHKTDCIVHLAAQISPQLQANPLVGFQVNTVGTVNMLETARILDIPRVVYSSSRAVYSPFVGEYGYPTYKPVDEDYPKSGNPGSVVYACCKVASEQMGLNYHQSYGIEFIALRFSNIYGIGKRSRHPSPTHVQMIENAMVHKPTIIPRGGDEKEDFMYVRDVANAVVLACLAKNVKHHIFNIGTGVGSTLHDFAGAIKKVYPDAAFDIGPGLDFRGRGPIYAVFDFSKAREELGYQPQYGLEAGVRDYVQMMAKLKIRPVYTPPTSSH
ncbi:MAG: NAD(P)-dependent oxidoreductase [Chloroflexi bacterium]|nr:NAD(P)-dependent oxidoreductase [Chloroflexota bacterium]